MFAHVFSQLHPILWLVDFHPQFPSFFVTLFIFFFSAWYLMLSHAGMCKEQAGFPLEQCSLQFSAAHIFPVADVLAVPFAFGLGFGFPAFSAAFEAAVFFVKGFREPVRNSSSESMSASLPMAKPD